MWPRRLIAFNINIAHVKRCPKFLGGFVPVYRE
ncbi:hypothetical protein ACVIWU_001566 [Bradyrhizobium sp. USDA 4509]